MFDFTNTPITKDTVLQAQWECGKPALTYYGDWGRATASDGRTYELTNINDFNTFVTASTPTQTFSFTDITPVETVKFEFGTKVTYTPVITFRLEAWPNLAEVNGFHEGLTTINNYCFCTYQAANDTSTVLIKGNIILPSTLTGKNHLAAGFMYRADRFVGNLVFNNPLGSLQTEGTTCSTTNVNAPFYKTGVNALGRYVSEWGTALPNRDTSTYRKFIPANTQANFLDYFKGGSAATMFPPGTKFKSDLLYSEADYLIVHYGDATLADGTTANGVYLMRTAELGSSGSAGSQISADLDKWWASVGEAYNSAPSGDLAPYLATIKVPYWNGSNLTKDLKVFFPSKVELAVYNPGYAEGKPWDYFWLANGSKYNSGASTYRALSRYGYWMRGAWTSADAAGHIAPNGAAATGSADLGWMVAVFLPFPKE